MIKRKMMFNYPFFNPRSKLYPYRYYNYPYYKNKYDANKIAYVKTPINKEIPNEDKVEPSNWTENSNSTKNEQFFSILGIKLYFDDLIILALLYFLYSEGVKDDGLFICLILLLLT